MTQRKIVSTQAKTPSVAWRHTMEYWGWRFAEWVLARLSRRALVRLADICGVLLYDVLRLRRRIVDANISHAFGAELSPPGLRALARRAYCNAVLTFFEFVHPRYCGQEALTLVSHIDGAEYLSEARATPAVFVTAHMGNWELLGHAVQAMGFNLDGIMKPLHNPLINSRVVARRRAGGLGLISTDGTMKAIVSSLRAGRHPVFLADQDARRDGIFVDFMGRPASTALGPAFFSYKFGVPIYAGFCVRNDDPERSCSMIVCPPIYPNTKAPQDAELERLTKAHVHALEAVVRKYPASYFWLHRRWKTKPKPQTES